MLCKNKKTGNVIFLFLFWFFLWIFFFWVFIPKKVYLLHKKNKLKKLKQHILTREIQAVNLRQFVQLANLMIYVAEKATKKPRSEDEHFVEVVLNIKHETLKAKKLLGQICDEAFEE